MDGRSAPVPDSLYANVRYGDGQRANLPNQASQEAIIKVKTPLKAKYWRNGRRNLQCFPSCKVFGDYSAIKTEDLKQHDFMWGKCRGSLVCEVALTNANTSFDDIVIMGRVHSLENIPVPFEEAVIRECMIGRVMETDAMEAMKEKWITGERLPDFIQTNPNIASYEFKPKVWKYQDDMKNGKSKRRNVRYYIQFEAFMPVMNGDRRCYVCIGSGMSSSFDVGSSRVLARQKRKAATSTPPPASSTPTSTSQSLSNENMTPKVENLNMPMGTSNLNLASAAPSSSNPVSYQPPSAQSLLNGAAAGMNSKRKYDEPQAVNNNMASAYSTPYDTNFRPKMMRRVEETHQSAVPLGNQQRFAA